MDYTNELIKLETCPNFDIPEDLLENKKIILYGAGDLGHLAITLMGQKGLKPLYVVDKSENKKGSLLDGVLIKFPEDITESEKRDCLFLICVASVSYAPIYVFLSGLGIKNIIQFYTYGFFKFPELISNGYVFDVKKNINDVKRVCDLLKQDKYSLTHFLQFLWWKKANVEKIYDGFPVLSGKKYFGIPCLRKSNENEIFVDCGTHFGQSIEKFIHWSNNEFCKIYAFEPDEGNIAVAKGKFDDKRIVYSTNAVSDISGKVKFKKGLGYSSKIDNNSSEIIDCVALDDLKIDPTIIKLHIEGNELHALKGMVGTIKRAKPIIMCLADHNEDGVCEIPLFLASFGYTLHFYLHDYCGNTAVWYAMP